jgi:hypothetical protein
MRAHTIKEIEEALKESQGQCASIADDIERLKRIINDAIPILIDNFGAIVTATEAQKVLSSHILKLLETVALPETVEKLASEQSEVEWRISEGLGLATRAIQFQDMVNQLGDNVIHRLNIIDEMLQESVCENTGVRGQLPKEAGVVEGIRQKVEKLRELKRRNPVAQDSIDEGEVELF